MAFGFIKKVFSFGKKEVEERPAQDEALPPLNLDALEGFKGEAPGKVPEAPPEIQPEAREETPPEPMVELGPAQPREIPETPEAPERPSVEEEPPTHPVPAPGRPAPEPIPPQPEPGPEIPAPAEPQPSPEPVPQPDIPTPAEPEPTKPPETPTPEQPPEIPAPIEPLDEPQAASREPVSGEAAPHPPAGTFSPQAGRRATGRDAEAPLSPSLRGEGKGEGQVTEPDRRDEVKTQGAKPSAPAPAGHVTVAKSVERNQAPEKAPEPAPAPRQSWFQRMRAGLSRSSRELTGNIAGIFTRRKLDEDTLQDLEDVLIRADLGVETAIRVTDALASGRYGRDISDAEVRGVMATEMEKVLAPVALPLELDLSHKPHVILVVGVNGTGKTTTIGKLAAKLTQGGLSVMLAAGDTFRAAAIEQLKIWGERTHSPVIASKLGADAAGLAYDAFEKAKEAGSDVLIIDTAGRLQNKAELMAELEKIVRVLGKLDPEAPHTVLQTVDATTGQNALNQVEIFRNIAGVNGLVLTKLDGTARGGILVAIAAKHKLPVYFIGVGEQVDDLEPFSAKEFAEAIAGVA
jgi:fused signal recognition particle receptor